MADTPHNTRAPMREDSDPVVQAYIRWRELHARAWASWMPATLEEERRLEATPERIALLAEVDAALDHLCALQARTPQGLLAQIRAIVPAINALPSAAERTNADCWPSAAEDEIGQRGASLVQNMAAFVRGRMVA